MSNYNYSYNWRRGINQYGNRYDNRGQGQAKGDIVVSDTDWQQTFYNLAQNETPVYVYEDDESIFSMIIYIRISMSILLPFQIQVQPLENAAATDLRITHSALQIFKVYRLYETMVYSVGTY
ncbi:unnamed protein product [Rotaria sp. Silwood1]|nr:unnamed protein product [Rotaria sp. Silwood1]